MKVEEDREEEADEEAAEGEAEGEGEEERQGGSGISCVQESFVVDDEDGGGGSTPPAAVVPTAGDADAFCDASVETPDVDKALEESLMVARPGHTAYATKTHLHRPRQHANRSLRSICRFV